RLLRRDAVAGVRRGRARAADADLDDLVAEEALRLDAGDRVLSDAIAEPPGDREIHADLAARFAGQVDARDAADLHPGQPDGRPLGETAHFAELRVDGVLRLEQPGLRAERVDHPQKCHQRHQDEDAHAQLASHLAPLVVHVVTTLTSPARKPCTTGSAEFMTSLTGPITANRPFIRMATRSATVRASSTSCVTTIDVSHTPSFSRRMSSPTSLEFVGSSPAVGSSNSSISGSITSARAMPTRLR